MNEMTTVHLFLRINFFLFQTTLFSIKCLRDIFRKRILVFLKEMASILPLLFIEKMEGNLPLDYMCIIEKSIVHFNAKINLIVYLTYLL